MRLTFPSWLSWYKKPEYRDFKEYANNVSSGKRALSPDGRKGAIPSRLRLERILANKTCSPMSLYDFYMYLKYIEFSAENLEFYIWYKSYEAAYAKGLTGTNGKHYASIPSATASTSTVTPIKTGDSQSWIKDHDGDGNDDSDGEDSPETEATNETLQRISQLISTEALCTKSACAPFSLPTPPGPTKGQKPAGTLNILTSSAPNVGGGQPNPLHDLSTITSLFLLPSSPKELNIPPALRDQALAALARSSTGAAAADPVAALRPVADHVYSLLRNCSHRNFVRLGVGNGTFETVCVATVLGWANLLAGFLLVLCRGLAAPGGRGAHSRWEAWAAWPLWWLGMSLVLSGLRGSCFFLLLFGRRQPLPWERFDDDDDGSAAHGSQDADGEGAEGKDGASRRRGKREGAGRGAGLSANKRVGGRFNLRRAVGRLMIFDRRIRVKERHLRRLQRKIVLQSLAGGGVFATLCVLLFLWLPIWQETV